MAAEGAPAGWFSGQHTETEWDPVVRVLGVSKQIVMTRAKDARAPRSAAAGESRVGAIGQQKCTSPLHGQMCVMCLNGRDN